MKPLTEREAQALRLLSQGHSCKGAAQSMRLSRYTVDDYFERARLKLGAKTNTQAAVIAAQKGLI